jgi:hypothetical protein
MPTRIARYLREAGRPACCLWTLESLHRLSCTVVCLGGLAMAALAFWLPGTPTDAQPSLCMYVTNCCWPPAAATVTAQAHRVAGWRY